MTQNMQKPNPERTRWLGAELKERSEHLDKLYIKHPSVRKILDYIDTELVSRAADGHTSGLLIISPSGAGKSALIKHLINRFPAVETDEFRTCPVVAFNVPPVPSPKTMGAGMLKAMGDVLWDTGTAEKKLDRIAVLLAAAKTKLVLIDNFQDIPMRRRSRGVLNVATWVRDICDINFGGIVIAIGTAEAAQVRDANEQVQRRIQARLNLPTFGGETRDDLINFSKLLKSFDHSLPLAEDSGIYLGDMPKRIHCATHGNFDYLIKLLKRAIEIAVANGHERLSIEVLFDAFSQQHQLYAAPENPFSPDYLWSNLAQPGQVFYNVAFPVELPEEEAVA
jgi:hypothetical protein